MMIELNWSSFVMLNLNDYVHHTMGQMTRKKDVYEIYHSVYIFRCRLNGRLF